MVQMLLPEKFNFFHCTDVAVLNYNVLVILLHFLNSSSYFLLGTSTVFVPPSPHQHFYQVIKYCFNSVETCQKNNLK